MKEKEKQVANQQKALKLKHSREFNSETHSPSIYDPPIRFPQNLKKNQLIINYLSF